MSDETPQPFEPPSTLGVIGSTSAVALTATVLVFVVTAWGWHGTVWAFANYGAFVVLPLVVFAALLTHSVGQTIAALFIAAICGGPLYVWELPEVRAAVAEHAGGALPGSTVMLAIQDPDTRVADAACVSLVSRGYDTVRFQLPELVRRPDVVASCLTRDVEGTDAPALLRREVAQMWEGKILTSNTPNVCKLLPEFVTVSGAQTADMPARILRIATTAARQEVRVCAMEMFAQQYPTPLKQLQALGNPSDVDPVVGADLFRGLTTITYAPLTTGIHKKMTNTPLMKQWGLSLGCRLLVEDVQATESAPMLNTAVSLQGCGQADGDNALLVWSQTCSAVLEGSRDGLVTTSAVCDRIHTFALDNAIATASTIVHSAIERLTQLLCEVMTLYMRIAFKRQLNA